MVALPAGAFEDALLSRDGAGNLAMLLGHELQHALNTPQMRTHILSFADQAISIGKRRDAESRDYSAPMEAMLEKNLWDESRAQVQAWNVLVSRLEAEGIPPTLEKIHSLGGWRTNDFVDVDSKASPATYSLKPGPSLNPDMALGATEANIDAS
ncbi:hypothetical protein OK348_17355 [Flavobacterium sp. MXW15]|uniref:Uncharacterized protein n=1 Tax=Xanthomonas chitinilytica TaxID=2989819 RepID=A0ABT3K0K1_9XANT|nr:hypothetical protein [Xanthomonas sp. H13-6]MCW4456548.1 hypothetical protein [Flavobacterium sp. MXW15]MCW4474251.1 hypothetical protein [Xanthomonas sp. H13-6]